MKLERLLANPEKPVVIPERPKNKRQLSAPDFVRNVMGSSAGAGSGEFHVYRHLRRKEYARQKNIQEIATEEALDEEFERKREEKQRAEEMRTAKKREKRNKKKNKKRKISGKGNVTSADTKPISTDDDTSDEDTHGKLGGSSVLAVCDEKSKPDSVSGPEESAKNLESETKMSS